MPEFTLNSDALPEFTKGYVEALFFTNGDTGADDEDKLNRPAHGQASAPPVPRSSGPTQTCSPPRMNTPATARGKPVATCGSPGKGTAPVTGIAGFPAPSAKP